jgi:hypothetical protein
MDKFISLKQAILLFGAVFALGGSWFLWGKAMWDFPDLWAQEKQEIRQEIQSVEQVQTEYFARQASEEKTQTNMMRDMIASQYLERCFDLERPLPECQIQQDSLRGAWRAQDSTANARLDAEIARIRQPEPEE